LRHEADDKHMGNGRVGAAASCCDLRPWLAWEHDSASRLWMRRRPGYTRAEL